MASISASPFSLRPWPTGDKKPKNLSEFISRVNAERNGFRNVTEAKLREEIAAQEEGRMDVDAAEGSTDDEEDPETDKSKGVIAARDEFLRNLEFAHQSALLGLDFISLLLSKETPVQTAMTLSPALRDLVGIGTLGASKLGESNVTEAKVQDDLAVATGWRVMDTNNMVDSVLAAAERLEKEIELETKYWADVLSVSEDGWPVCPLPREPQTLGVRFGFAESAPEFRNNSIAPLIRKDDGTVHLGIGKLGAGSQRVRITVKKDGKIVDQSPLPQQTSDDAPLKDRVLEARNTIYHQELWYELNREARTLLSSDVYYDGSSITWKQNSQTDMIFTLEELAEKDERHTNFNLATCSCIASSCFMQYLLFQGHRQSYFKRTSITSQPPNPVAAIQPYSIIRALIARFRYFDDSAILENFLDELVLVLRRAGISTASYTSTILYLGPDSSQTANGRHNARMEVEGINRVVARLATLYTLTTTPEARIWTHSRAQVVPWIGVTYGMTVSDPFTDPQVAKQWEIPYNGASSEQDQPQNPLSDSYPPARDVYPGSSNAVYYHQQATVRGLAQKMAEVAGKNLGRDDIDWNDTIRGICITNGRGREVTISISSVDKKLELVLDGQWPSGTGRATRRWTWGAHGDDAGESLEAVVVKVLGGNV
ncbi:Uu.00g118710.m01.CDS01 [Anthostomella pinea]|uniref:Mediator of RNA polymerase II transcription subunit 17 n=1 Tax=Anthostomella pinea TaxID=933095 RepID=A0AAI8VB87_9PEZI|nr:Uu.00g118710.m01.CDS01 [Anthostomella pinea]